MLVELRVFNTRASVRRHLCAFVTLCSCSTSDHGRASSSPDTLGHAYETDFPRAENPLSESGRWLTGRASGVDWADVATTPHRAFGLQGPVDYSDATAILRGSWGPDQRVSATVFTTTAPLKEECYSEVELRLRSVVAYRYNRGYEITYKVSQSPLAYLIIVRWNGSLGDYTYLFRDVDRRYAIQSGDTISASIVGNVITAYRNGEVMARVSDSRFATGNPGIGFALGVRPPGCANTHDHYGFSRVVATDRPPE